MKLRGVTLLSLALASVCAQAQEAADNGEKVAEVSVSALRNPELKPYRVMSAGLDAFDEHRKLAPNASLKFKLSKRGEGYGAASNWNGVTLRLVGNDSSSPVPIEADGSFVLPRNQAAWDDEAELILNQKKAAARFHVDVRTPGLPANARRLGDLRLECQVLIAIGKKELNFAMRAAFTTAFRTGDWCSAPSAKVATGLPDWSLNTTIVDGATRTQLAPHASKFNAPIQDKKLSDDALIEFEYWGTASPERKQQFIAQWPLSVRTSMNKWGAGTALQLKEKGIYSAPMQLKAGTWMFNLESQGREVNLGARAKNLLTAMGADQALQWYGERLNLKVEQAGSYEFTLNLQDPDHPLFKVTPVN
jgi:hypothetical protein